MKFLLTIIWLISTLFTSGQPCDCLKALNFLEIEYEQNLASYQHQVVQYKRVAEYEKYKNSINLIAAKISDTRNCVGLVSRYQAFFRDEHLFVNYKEDFYKFSSLNDSDIIANTFKNEQRLLNKISQTTDKKLEGIWYFQDGSFAVNIIASKGVNREWAAVMEADFSPFWFKGQIKMEFIKDENNELNCIYWRGKRTPKYMKTTLTDSVLCIGREFKFYRNKKQVLSEKSKLRKDFEFEQLSISTNYLRIPSFDLENFKLIDSLVARNLGEIEKAPNLIIDLRDNGGGGDHSYKALLPLIFDSKIIRDPITASVWVSENNFKYYDSTKFDIAETKVDSINEINYVEKLRPYIGNFQPIVFVNDTLKLVYPYPKKIVLLTNRWCGSSTEGFVMLAKESKKVIQMGENTGGMVSYGDWRRIELPELPIWVTCTTKKMTFFNGQDIESIGITPNILFDATNENKWIEQVQKYLEQ